MNSVERVTARTPEQVAAELRRRVDADIARHAGPGAQLEPGEVLFPPCQPAGPGVPTAVRAGYGVRWRVDAAEGERLLAAVRADWPELGEVDEQVNGVGDPAVFVVEPDGYDRGFTFTRAPDDGGGPLVAIQGTSPCAALPEGSRLPTG